MEAALMRDLRKSAGQYRSELAKSRKLDHALARASKALRERLAGLWLEPGPDGEPLLVAAVRDEGELEQDSNELVASGVDRVKAVRHTLKQLQQIQASVERWWQDTGTQLGIYSVEIDVPRNQVSLQVQTGFAAAARAQLTLAGIDPTALNVVETEYGPSTTGSTIIAGRAYAVYPPNDINKESRCSFGFTTARGIMTAGHCFNHPLYGTGKVDYLLFSSPQRENGMGIFTSPWSLGADGDYAWINQNTGWSRAAQVDTWGGVPINIIGMKTVPIGGSVCRSGYSSKQQCGVVQGYGATVMYSAQGTLSSATVKGLTRISACVTKGDSGGPAYSPSGEAQGIVSGGNINVQGTNCGIDKAVTYITPIHKALRSRYDHLLTVVSCGRLNPGYRINSGYPMASCSGDANLAVNAAGEVWHRAYWNKSAPAFDRMLAGPAGAGAWVEMLIDGRLALMRSDGTVHTVIASGASQVFLDIGRLMLLKSPEPLASDVLIRNMDCDPDLSGNPCWSFSGA